MAKTTPITKTDAFDGLFDKQEPRRPIAIKGQVDVVVAAQLEKLRELMGSNQPASYEHVFRQLILLATTEKPKAQRERLAEILNGDLTDIQQLLLGEAKAEKPEVAAPLVAVGGVR